AADVMHVVFSAAGICIFVGLFVLLAVRWHRASAARRRVLTPVYLSGGAAVVFLGIGFAIGFASGTAGSVFWALALGSFVALPFFFVGGLLRGRFARAGLRL